MGGIDEWGALLPGSRIAGYEIKRKLGQGGFGIAYEAFHPALHQRAAIKEFFPRDMVARSGTSVSVREGESRGFYERFLKRFIEEARAVNKLDHPNIVKVRHFEEANNTAYVVMDYVDGQNLKGWLEERRGKLAESDLKSVFAPILDALAYVHDQNVLHRDISPLNIMVDRTGKPWLIDFGAFKDMWQEQPRRTSLLAANPAYAPPEQSDAGAGQDHGPFTDVFALSATMYEAIAGHKPASATARMSQLAFRRADTLAPLETEAVVKCRPEMLRAVMRGLSLSPEDRPQTVAAFRQEIGWGAETGRSTARPGVGAGAATTPVPRPISEPRIEALRPATTPPLQLPPPAIAPQGEQRRGGKGKWIALSAVLLIGLAGAGLWSMREPIFDKMADIEYATIATSTDATAHEAFAKKHPGTKAGLRAERRAVELRRPVAVVVNGFVRYSDRSLRDGAQRRKRRSTVTSLEECEQTCERDSLCESYEYSQGRCDRYEWSPSISDLVEAGNSIFGIRHQRQKAGPKVTVAAPKKAGNDPLDAEQERALKPKDEFQECDVCPKMVVVPAGEFLMGSPPDEKESDEGPQHRVTIPRALAVGKFTVTFAEWDACAADGGCQSNKTPSDQGWGRDKRPVINVSWSDAQEYVAWLTKKTGKDYRLLSEAEWEYAARANTTSPYWWGNGIGRNQANCDGCGSKWDNKQTAPVGSFPANDFGLYDMHGNVWQWVEDCYVNSYNGAPVNGVPRWEKDCSHRVRRGGSWSFNPRNVRSTFRGRGTIVVRVNDGGFRLGRTLDVPEKRSETPPPATPPVPEKQVSVTLPATAPAPRVLPTHVLAAAEERALNPKDEFQECAICPRMVVIPAGKFLMGPAPDDKDRKERDGPQKEISIAAFVAGKFPITFDEWNACVSDGGCRTNRSPNDKGFGRGKRPVINVFWADAQEYVQWLSRKTGKPYRLLTAAEFEYAARAGSKTRFWWGNDVGVNNANCSGCGSQWDGRMTAPVGSFPANPFGLHDMTGNAAQWVEDCSFTNLESVPADGRANKDTSCNWRLFAGGGYYGPPEFITSTARTPAPFGKLSDTGFRVARTIAP